MFGLETEIRLPFKFDTELLNRDLLTAETFEFSTHPLKYHDGTWQAINLVYSGGKIQYTHEGNLGYGDDPPLPTPVLAECPYFRHVLDSFGTPIKMARLSALPPGGRILRHHDPVESVDFGMMRIHIPIRNDPEQVVFHLAFRRRWWQPGETWYGDFTFPHSVHNGASYNRVNMIVDVEMTDNLLATFPRNYMSQGAKARRAFYRAECRSVSWRLGQLQSRHK
jgi:hypothetical protein